MDGRYLTFPELPPGHHYSFDVGSELAQYDVDILFSGEGKDYDRNKIGDQLVAWVSIGMTIGTFVRERSLVTHKHTYELHVADPQEGIDLIVARLWMGMTGEL